VPGAKFPVVPAESTPIMETGVGNKDAFYCEAAVAAPPATKMNLSATSFESHFHDDVKQYIRQLRCSGIINDIYYASAPIGRRH